MGGRAWSQSEIDSLIEMYSSHTVIELAEYLNRPESTIYYKIRELKTAGELT